ncbi:DUF3293 domain-containing protein [Dongshaea marina]|uniref:DUF3293 domain-containing protein n=1 Tax=Dongshaea marina TaxID=2047966 RepID=UPI000D3E613B|nr:DUF3293 domain-containing protein [Dongshaea marina]
MRNQACFGDNHSLWKLYQEIFFIFPEPYPESIHFAIITACNPDGMLLDARSNQQRDRELVSFIERRGWDSRVLWGCARDLNHYELSHGICCSREEAIRLARTFNQKAFYWCTQGELWLETATMEPHEAIHLTLLGERLLPMPADWGHRVSHSQQISQLQTPIGKTREPD